MATKTVSKAKKPFVIIRTYSAGVHIGYLESRKGQEVKLSKSRRVWYWKGAASLSQMAVDGIHTSGISECKFSVVVPEIELTQAIEVIKCTPNAIKNLQGVPVWKI